MNSTGYIPTTLYRQPIREQAPNQFAKLVSDSILAAIWEMFPIVCV